MYDSALVLLTARAIAVGRSCYLPSLGHGYPVCAFPSLHQCSSLSVVAGGSAFLDQWELSAW